MKNLTKTAAAVLIALACSSAAHAAGSLDFEDCDVLAGKSHAAEFRRTLADQRQSAARGDFDAKAFLAGIANNRFACLAEAIGGDGTGWSVTVSADDAGQGGSSQTTTKLARSEAIRQNPQALSALHEARDRAQDLADSDAGYRSMASQFVADYPDLFGDTERTAAYRDAAGVEALSCGHPRVLGKDRSAALCANAKSQIASLTPRIDTARRNAAGAAGRQWADAHAKRGGSQ